MTDWGDDEPEHTPTSDAPRLYYGSVAEFYDDYLRHIYRRRVDGKSRVWAADWWRYEEAIIRLEALWRSWEQLRLDPSTGVSTWLRDHADHHMSVLFDPEGPFAGADRNSDVNQCGKGEPLPHAEPPPGLFVDVRAPEA